MKIKYLAHASFLITSNAGVRIITDPYLASYVAGDTPGYAEIEEKADIVTVSHDHSDHNNISAVRGNPEIVKGAGTSRVKGINFKGISSFHDDKGGSLRGSNTIFCFEVDGIKVCHIGDLGQQLNDGQTAEIGSVDILLIPVGGYYTIDARTAAEVCNKLRPGVIIPMHYKTDRCGFPITGVDGFLRGKRDVSRPESSEVEFKKAGLPAAGQIMVLKPSL